jgi:hypothetical protein
MPEMNCPICRTRIEGNGDLADEMKQHFQEYHAYLLANPEMLGQLLFAAFHGMVIEARIHDNV